MEFIYDSVVDALEGKDTLTGVVLYNTKTEEYSMLECDGIFVAIGQMPENEPFLHVASLNEYGYVNAGEDCETGTKGVFVAGDCRSKRIRQITTATGDGAVAAVAACRYVDSLS